MKRAATTKYFHIREISYWAYEAALKGLHPRSVRYVDDQLSIAFHEAGHAVLHVLLQIPFESAEIFNAKNRAPLESRHLAGQVKRADWLNYWQFDGHGPECEYDYAHREVAISLAGQIAEELYTGDDKELGAAYDREHIRDIKMTLLPDSTKAETKHWKAGVKILWGFTERLLQRPEVWAAVKAVAYALLRRNRLSATAVRRIVSKAGCDNLSITLPAVLPDTLEIADWDYRSPFFELPPMNSERAALETTKKKLLAETWALMQNATADKASLPGRFQKILEIATAIDQLKMESVTSYLTNQQVVSDGSSVCH
jgi:hypothetical protein